MIVSHHVGMRTRPGSFAGDVSPASDHSSSELSGTQFLILSALMTSNKSLHYQKKKKKKMALTKVGSSISKTITSPLSQ